MWGAAGAAAAPPCSPCTPRSRRTPACPLPFLQLKATGRIDVQAAFRAGFDPQSLGLIPGFPVNVVTGIASSDLIVTIAGVDLATGAPPRWARRGRPRARAGPVRCMPAAPRLARDPHAPAPPPPLQASGLALSP